MATLVTRAHQNRSRQTVGLDVRTFWPKFDAISSFEVYGLQLCLGSAALSALSVWEARKPVLFKPVL